MAKQNPPKYRLTYHVSQCVRNALKPTQHKVGFMQAQLILDWHLIVGPEIANLCTAEKVIFEKGTKGQGILYATATSTASTLVTYMEPTLIEKINCYFGYPIIKKIILKNKSQKEIKRKINKNEIKPNNNINVDDYLLDINNPSLKESLRALGKVLPK